MRELILISLIVSLFFWLKNPWRWVQRPQILILGTFALIALCAAVIMIRESGEFWWAYLFAVASVWGGDRVDWSEE